MSTVTNSLALQKVREMLAEVDNHEKLEGELVEYRNEQGVWVALRDDLNELRRLLEA